MISSRMAIRASSLRRGSRGVTLNSDVSWKCNWIFAASSNVRATGCSGPPTPPDRLQNAPCRRRAAIFSVVSSIAEYAVI